MRPLRIAVLLNVFPVVSETFILRQITGLLDAGHDVRIFAQRPPDRGMPQHPEVAAWPLLDRTVYVDERLPELSGYWEMPVHPFRGSTWTEGMSRPVPNARRVAEALPTIARLATRHPRATVSVLRRKEFGYQADSLSALFRLDVLARDAAPVDVCHAHFGPTGNTFRMAPMLWDAPLVVSFHGYDVSSFPQEQGAGVYDRLFATAGAVIANSAYTAAQLRDLECPSDLVHIIPVGVDPASFPVRLRRPPPDGVVRLLTVARLVPVKGVEHAVEAVAELRRRGCAVRYDVVGDGPERNHVEDLVRRLDLGEHVTLHGAQDGKAVRGHLDRADLFLLPSVSVEGVQEAQGLVLQEAQACGIPVIATRTGGIPESLDPGRSGLLVPERDPQAIADAVQDLAGRPETWPAMGAAGRRLVETRFDVRRLNDDIVGLYRDLVGRRLTGARRS